MRWRDGETVACHELALVKVALPLLRKVFAWSFISFLAPNKLKLLIWVLTYENIASWYNERPKENSEKNAIIIKSYLAYWWWWLRSSYLPCKGTLFQICFVNIRKTEKKYRESFQVPMSRCLSVFQWSGCGRVCPPRFWWSLMHWDTASTKINILLTRWCQPQPWPRVWDGQQDLSEPMLHAARGLQVHPLIVLLPLMSTITKGQNDMESFQNFSVFKVKNMIE